MIEGFVTESILARAQKKGLAEICTIFVTIHLINGAVLMTIRMVEAQVW